MSNLFANTGDSSNELKIWYQGPIIDQLNNDMPIYRGAQKIKEGWSGLQVNRPLRVRRNQGIGATSDNGLLPAIGRQTTVQAVILAKYNYLRFGVTGPMIKASASDAGSFVRAAAFELKEGYSDLKNDLNRQLSWDGTSDIALVNTAAIASNTIVVKGRETAEPGNKFLIGAEGMVVDIYTGSTKTVSSVEITAVTFTSSAAGATATLTLGVPVTVSANDIVVRSGSFGNEVQGLLTTLDGGNSSVYSVDRSVYPAYQGNVVDAASQQLSLDLMQQAWNQGRLRGDAKYSAIYCNFDSERFYQKLLTSDKRYANTMKGDGGFASKDGTYLEWNTLPIVSDKDCPQRLFFLTEDAWKMYELAAMEFADESGSMYLFQTDTDAYEVRVRYFANLFCEKPAAQAVLTGYISP